MHGFERVIHTMAYFRSKFALGLKGRFYAKLFFVSKGKILHHHCLYVLNGKILRQTSYVKPNACAYIFKFIHKGKILRHGLFYCMIMASTLLNPYPWQHKAGVVIKSQIHII